jgi:Fe-S-cluster containining protein
MNQTDVPDRRVYEEEKEYSWLPILLDSYAICDEGTSKDLESEQKRRGRVVACHNGCSACCINPDIPISETEVRGISWYVSEQLDEKIQDDLIPRLQNHASTTECPFLWNHVCSIYVVRPIACRIFYVFGKACLPREDPVNTGPQDIFISNGSTAKRVAMRLLDSDVYGLRTRKEKEDAFDGGIMMRMSIQMHRIDWTRMVWAINSIRKARSKSK